ncbi:MAG: hypothetical protein KF689_12490 [Gemmatimonadaceae bacterium]|nr:hypothetical protein [Gemmatimonadaceae bacterium]MCW5827200.1 hypothetical protein [Gemmatimonadaceae bacterium]
MRFPPISAAGLLLLAVMGCDRGTPAAANVIRSDSAGVKIITSTGPDAELAWRFDTLGLLTDSLGEPWLFTGVSRRVVLTDRAGRTYVLENEPAIRRFGRDGRYERSFGRKGGAPGEMEFAYQLLQQGDSVAVLDLGRNAIVRWGPDLEPIQDLPRRGALDRVQGLAFRSGGAWVESSAFDSTGSRTMLYLDTLGSAPLFEVNEGRPKMMQACGGRLGFAMPAFFSPRIIWTHSGARMLATLGPDYRLQLFEGSRLIASIRRDLPQRAPTVADLQRMYPEGLKIRFGGGECTVPLDELLQTVGFAPVMLEVHGVALLADATMWVQRSVANEKPPVLDVFGSDGAYAGSVRGLYLPVGLLPNGELLVPLDDEDSGGLVIARMRVRK